MLCASICSMNPTTSTNQLATEATPSDLVHWRGYWPFVWGATGAAVSLINLWRFPHIVGDHGGGVFLLVYLLCVMILAVPIMLAELLIGRNGRGNPVGAVAAMASAASVSSRWRFFGHMTVLASIMILPVYSVIGGWALEYLSMAVDRRFDGITVVTSQANFSRFLMDQTAMLKWHTLLIFLSVCAVGFGIRPLSWFIKVLVPLMFIVMAVLLGAVVNLQSFPRAWLWMFELRPEQFTWDSLLLALGHGFLTLGIGLGVIMSYSAYLPDKTQMGRLVIRVGVLDLTMAVLAGLVILPLIFMLPDLIPLAGPQTLFVSLPVVFGSIENGYLLSQLFFAAVVLVALTSTIPLMEPMVAYLQARNISRRRATSLVGVLVWFLGLGVLFSFNQWQQLKVLSDMTLFETLAYVVANILMPVAGMVMAIMVGWLLPKDIAAQGFYQASTVRFQAWIFLLKYGAPLLIYAIFIVPMLQRWLA